MNSNWTVGQGTCLNFVTSHHITRAYYVFLDSVSSVQFSGSVVSDSLQPHGLQHTRPPCPSPTPGVYSGSCPLSQWCHPTISSSVVTFSSCHLSIRVFSNESALCIRWPNYLNFSLSISPSNEYSGLISFRIDWFGLLAAQETQESSPTPQFKSINSSVFSLLYGPTHIQTWLLEKS